MSKEKEQFDKEAVLEAFKEAVDNVFDEDENIEENVVDETPIDNIPSDDVVDIDVDNKVNEEVETAVEEDSHYNFLGIDITISKNEEDDNYSISLVKDDLTKEDVISDISLPSIFNSIDNFFTELVIDNETGVEKLPEETEEIIDEEELNDDSLIESELLGGKKLNDIRNCYSDEINKIFEHGLEAKEIALEMVKDSLLANNVKELVNKVKEKNDIIASKKEELNETTKNYILAKKVNKQFNVFNKTILSNINKLKDGLNRGLISKKLALKAMKNYNTILSKVINAEKETTIIAGIKALNETHKAIISNQKAINKAKAVVSNKVAEETHSMETEFHRNNYIRANKIPSSLTHRRIAGNNLNTDGMLKMKSLSANKRINEIDEMTAEISRIAGIV